MRRARGGRTSEAVPRSGETLTGHADAVTAVEANHYALLRTIEAGFDLPALGRAASPGTPVLSGLLRNG